MSQTQTQLFASTNNNPNENMDCGSEYPTDQLHSVAQNISTQNLPSIQSGNPFDNTGQISSHADQMHQQIQHRLLNQNNQHQLQMQNPIQQQIHQQPQMQQPNQPIQQQIHQQPQMQQPNQEPIQEQNQSLPTNNMEWIDYFIKVIKKTRGDKLETIKKGLLDAYEGRLNVWNYMGSVVREDHNQTIQKNAASSSRTKKVKVFDPTLKELEPCAVLGKLKGFYENFKMNKQDLLQGYIDGLHIIDIESWDIEKPKSIQEYNMLLPEIKRMKERDFSNLKHAYLFQFLTWINIGQGYDVMYTYYKENKKKEFKGMNLDMFVLKTYGSDSNGVQYYKEKRYCYLLALEFPSILYFFINAAVELFTPTA